MFMNLSWKTWYRPYAIGEQTGRLNVEKSKIRDQRERLDSPGLQAARTKNQSENHDSTFSHVK